MSKPSKNPIVRIREKVEEFFGHTIWNPDDEDLGWPLGPLYSILRVIHLAVRGIFVNRATFTASALTFTTVLSVVPLLAFAFSVAKGVGGYERLRTQVIEPFLAANLGPETSDTPEAIQSLHQAIDKVLELVQATDVGSLGLLGLSVLVIAVIRVLSGVEDAFNHIWSVRNRRSWLRRFSDYISLSVATPILLLLAVAVTTAAQNNALVDALLQRPGIGDLVATLFRLGPLVAVWLGLTLLYLILPNTSVHPVSAALGGFVGGSLWQLAQIGHVKFQIGMANYNAIYAGFAALPIFLAWIYVSWVTVMFGAEFAHAHQERKHHRQIKRLRLDMRRRQDLLVLRACAEVVRAFRAGDAPVRTAAVADLCGAPVQTLTDAIAPVVRAGLLTSARLHGKPAWTVGRDPSTVTVADVLAALHGMRDDAREDPLEQVYHDLLHSVREADANIDLVALSEKLDRG